MFGSERNNKTKEIKVEERQEEREGRRKKRGESNSGNFFANQSKSRPFLISVGSSNQPAPPLSSSSPLVATIPREATRREDKKEEEEQLVLWETSCVSPCRSRAAMPFMRAYIKYIRALEAEAAPRQGLCRNWTSSSRTLPTFSLPVAGKMRFLEISTDRNYETVGFTSPRFNELGGCARDSLSVRQIRKFPRPSLVLILDSLRSCEKILDLRVVKLKLANCTFDFFW